MLKLVQFAQRYRILEQTLALVGLVVAAKVGLHTLGWEFVAVSPLHASIVAGGIFILSVFLAGILPDYKEAERLPTEFAATVDSMFDDGVAISRTNPEFDSAGLRESLTSTLRALRSDILEGKRSAYAEIREITMALSDMERVNVPPNFITKLKQEQASLAARLRRTGAQAGEKAAAARERIQASLVTARAKLVEAERALVDRTKQAAKATDEFVHENPWKAVGIAAAVGFVLGVLISRR